jgi:hypothetical protein
VLCCALHDVLCCVFGACRFIGVYTGTVLRREETLCESQTNQQYLFDLNSHVTIDGSRGGNVTRYM